jgi:hypothetical protein
MPHTAIRRPVTITAWVIMSVVCLACSPLLLALAAIAGAVLRRPQPLLVARLVIAYFSRELMVLAVCAGLWVASGFGWRIHSRRFQRRHYRLLQWFVHSLATRTRTLVDIDVAPDASPEANASLARDRPLLFFSRHAGPGDTLLLVDQLMTGYDRLPNMVFKDALTLDPCVDLLGHRLPHAILDAADPAECEARIREVSAELGPRGALVLFPEGGNLTGERRRRAIAKLWRTGRRREARTGERMTHVLPPHPTGALAALHGNPDCDVIFAAHTGLGLAAFPRELWRHTPIGRTFKTRMWVVPPAERPRDPDEQVRWLYDWWQQIDTWLQAEGEPAPVAAPEPD